MNIFLLTFLLMFGNPVEITKQEFYSAFTSEDHEAVLSMIKKIQQAEQTPVNTAYHGALLMKQADFEKIARKKMELFNRGRQMLENEIAADTINIEYRLLRFIIQEHAPIILRYNSHLQNDKSFLKKNYHRSTPFIQAQIFHYAKRSKRLNQDDL